MWHADPTRAPSGPTRYGQWCCENCDEWNDADNCECFACDLNPNNEELDDNG